MVWLDEVRFTIRRPAHIKWTEPLLYGLLRRAATWGLVAPEVGAKLARCWTLATTRYRVGDRGAWLRV
jgi:hypothetical protein